MTEEDFIGRDKTFCEILHQLYLLNDDIQFFYGNSIESSFLLKKYGFFNRYVIYLPKLLTIEIDKIFNTNISNNKYSFYSFSRLEIEESDKKEISQSLKSLTRDFKKLIEECLCYRKKHAAHSDLDRFDYPFSFKKSELSEFVLRIFEFYNLVREKMNKGSLLSGFRIDTSKNLIEDIIRYKKIGDYLANYNVLAKNDETFQVVSTITRLPLNELVNKEYLLDF